MIVFSRRTHMVAYIRISFFIAEYYLSMWRTTFYWFMGQLANIWVVSTLRLLRAMLPWTSVCICGDTCFFPFTGAQGQGWSCWVTRYSVSTFGGTTGLFPSGRAISRSQQQGRRAPISPRPRQHLFSSVFLVVSSLGERSGGPCGFDLHFPAG